MCEWVKLEGNEPADFEDTDFAWIRSKDGDISLTETLGCVEWGDFTHFLPAPDIEYPEAPNET